MDRARYFAALFLLMTPGAFLYWFSIHPFIGFWRKLPPAITLGIHFLMMGAVAAILLLFRRTLLAVEFGGQPALEAAGVAFMAASLMLRARVSRHLTKRILMGVAELAPEQSPTPLLTKGPFAHVRNPRYLQVLMAVLACALFANYLAGYVLFAATALLVRIIIWMEERELRDRFGQEFEDYCARVPRLIPRLHNGGPR